MTHAFSRRSFLAALAAGTAGPALAKAPLTSLHPVARGEDLRLRTLRTPDEIIAAAEESGAPLLQMKRATRALEDLYMEVVK